MSRWIVTAALSVLLSFATGVARADYLVNERFGSPAGFAEYQSQSCFVNAPIGMGAQEAIVIVWRTQSPAGDIGYQAALAGSPALPLGALPAPAGWTWHQDVQIRSNAGDVSGGTVCVCGMLRSVATPRVYAVGALRGRLTSVSTLVWESPSVVYTPPSSASSILFLGVLAMDSFRASNRITMLHPTSFVSNTSISYWMRQSDDGGATWGEPIPVGNDSTTGGSCGVQYGATDSDLWVMWEQLVGSGFELVSREVLPSGAGFLPAETSPGGLFTRGFGPHGTLVPSGLATAANPDPSVGPGRALIVGTSSTAAAPAADFPVTTSTASWPELEPNGTFATATDIPMVGLILRGTLATSAPADTDWFALTLWSGQMVPTWTDSVTVGAIVEWSWFGPDGVSQLAGSSIQSQPFLFVAPTSGIYRLRVVRLLGTAPISYRVRTMTAPTSSSGSRDRADLFVWQRSPSAWQPAVNLSSTFAGVGPEEGGLAMCGNLDGYLYASWYDWGGAPGEDRVEQRMARSVDGGLSWSVPVTISASPSDWARAQLTTDSRRYAAGLHTRIATDGWNMAVTWTDARNGDPDIYLGLVSHSLLAQLSVAPPVEVSPGEQVVLEGTVQNYDSYFSWYYGARAEATTRNWSTEPSYGGQVSPGGSGPLYATFTVPDTAAPGPVSVRVRVASAFAPANTVTQVFMTIQVVAALGVGAEGPRLDLAPPSPNPARGSARVAWSLARPGEARLEVFSVDGRLVRTLVRGAQPAGPQQAHWAGDDDAGHAVGNGVFFIRLRADGRDIVRRLVRME